MFSSVLIYVFALLPWVAVSFTSHCSNRLERRGQVGWSIIARKRTSSVLSSTLPNSNVDELRAELQIARDKANRLSLELNEQLGIQSDLAAKLSPGVKEVILAFVKDKEWRLVSELSCCFGSANLRVFPVSLNLLQQKTGLTVSMLGMGEKTKEIDYIQLHWIQFVVTCIFSIFGLFFAVLLQIPTDVFNVILITSLVIINWIAVTPPTPRFIHFIQSTMNKIGGIRNNYAAKEYERILRREAAHLCCGYWCGLPVQSYFVNKFHAQVEFDYFSTRYSHTKVPALAVTGLAGLVVDGMHHGKAQDETNALLTVDRFLDRWKRTYHGQERRDLKRWAAFTAATLLKQNEEKYEEVVLAMSNQADLLDCIAILEK